MAATNESADKRLFLLDAYALIYRAHFALIRNPLINSKGMNVSAISGFTNTLNDLLRREQPSHLAVVFDLGTTTREEEFSYYKANRQEMPEDIAMSIPIIKEVVRGFNVPVIELEGYEADDLIGTLAKQAEKQGYTTYMVTPDKDFGQLISENIFMYKPAYMGKPIEVIGLPEVLEKWQIDRPEQVIDILGLMGDSVDNIPGIPKVGPKTAMKLIGQYGSVEEVIAHGDEIKGKLGENVREFAQQGLDSKLLATIILDAPIEFKEDEFLVEPPDKEKLGPLFAELEFRTIGKRILGDDFNISSGGVRAANRTPKPAAEPAGPSTGQMDLFGGGGNAATAAPAAAAATAAAPEVSTDGADLKSRKHAYQLVESAEGRAELLAKLKGQKSISLALMLESFDANLDALVGIALSWESGQAAFVSVPEEQSAAEAVVGEFAAILEDPEIKKAAFDIKEAILILRRYGVRMQGGIEDMTIAHYLIEPEKSHRLGYMAEAFLSYAPVDPDTVIGKRGKNQLTFRQAQIEKVSDYACEQAELARMLQDAFHPMMEEHGTTSLYRDMELPLARVLSDMEYEGVAIDTKFLRAYSEEMASDVEHIRKEVYEMAGIEFNLDSPKQLGTTLFDHMGIPYKGKKTKTGQYSTSEDQLTKLAGDQPIVEKILEYRHIGKLKSTYVDALPDLINPRSGRVHTTMSQTVAATGRLSSNNPNLQNIPIRTDRGRRIRKAFVPRDKDHLLMAADYSQIELRIIAAISGDEAMKQAFIDGVDIHTSTAARVYGMELEEVTSNMRRNAKMVNFGIIYGISAFGLAPGHSSKGSRWSDQELLRHLSCRSSVHG